MGQAVQERSSEECWAGHYWNCLMRGTYLGSSLSLLGCMMACSEMGVSFTSAAMLQHGHFDYDHGTHSVHGMVSLQDQVDTSNHARR